MLPEAAQPSDPRPCPECGYDLRGLPEGRLCPECGGDTSRDPSGTIVTEGGVRRRPLIDLLNSGSDAERARWQRGLSLAAMTLVALALVGVCGFVANAIAGGSAEEPVAVLVTGLACLWCVAVMLVLPRSIASAWRWMGPVRLVALGTQPMWVLIAAWHLLAAFDAVPILAIGVAPFALAAIVGAVCVAALMSYVSEEAELDRTTRRLNLVAWMLPIAAVVLTLVLAIFPTTFGGIPAGPWGLLLILFLLPAAGVVGGSAWVIVQFALGLLEMRHHARWGRVHLVESRERQQRIDAKRARLERKAARKVRALPVDHDGEVTLGPERPARNGTGS